MILRLVLLTETNISNIPEMGHQFIERTNFMKYLVLMVVLMGN